MARPQLDQVADVRDVCQLRHFHKVLLRRTAAWTNEKENGKRKLQGGKTKEGISFKWINGFCPLFFFSVIVLGGDRFAASMEGRNDYS